MAAQIHLQLGSSPSFINLHTCADQLEMAQQTSINNALGTLIGYIGAEAATEEVFERLLWPQRFYNGFSLWTSIKLALFLPMGAPLHKAALKTLDQIRKNGLFRGQEQGHMLASPFYHDNPIKYLSHGCHASPEQEDADYVRNCLWIRAIANLAFPPEASLTGARSVETGLRKTPTSCQTRTRAINRVSHLRLSCVKKVPKSQEIVGYETGDVTLRGYMALVVTELTGIFTGIIVGAAWRSWFMLLWFVPIILKVVSAFLSMSRGHLEIPSQHYPSEASPSSPTIEASPLTEKLQSKRMKQTKFEIHDPLHGFLIIEGDEDLILQFFRHYGHPIRNRFRECSQIFIITIFGCLFPVGLVCSVLWMPPSVQYTWLFYQMYATIAMYVYHFAGGHALGTTEQKIADIFQSQVVKGQKQQAYFGGQEGTLLAELEVTYHNRVKDGKAHMLKLLSEEIQGFGLPKVGSRMERHTMVDSATPTESGKSTPDIADISKKQVEIGPEQRS